MCVKVGSVYSTSDYSVFKKLRGNREIFDNRKKHDHREYQCSWLDS